MKIAYLTNLYPKVSHTFVRREIKALEGLGCHVLRLAIRRTGERLIDPDDQREHEKTRALLDGGLIALLLPTVIIFVSHVWRFLVTLSFAVRIGWRSDRGCLIHLIYLMEACRLLRWVRSERVDHVHAHFGTNPAAVAMLCRLLGGPPYSFTVHGPYEFDHAPILALGHKIAHASFVVAISDFCRSQLYRWCAHEDWPKVHVVRCGLDAGFLSQPTVPISKTPRMLCVGRLCEQKGQLLLLEAAERLVLRGTKFELILAGDGEMRRQIELLIQRLGLSNCIRITGWISNDQVRRELVDCRAMVLPSFAEGLPVVIMEALAMGRPVISTYVAGIPELVRSGENGWLVPAGAVEELTEAMAQVLDTPIDRLTAMGRTGAERVAEFHDADREARRLEALFRSSIQGSDLHNPSRTESGISRQQRLEGAADASIMAR